MNDNARHPGAFEAHTMSLSCRDGTYSPRERRAWRCGCLAGLSAAVFGGLGALLLIALLRSI
jgi:hypothetical protein